MKRILFIRGGALGDFIVTLPTLRLLRQRWPEAHIEVLGHPQIAEIGLDRYYLNAIRSVNHGPLSAFFMPRAVLDPAWMDYVGSFRPRALLFLRPGRILLRQPAALQAGSDPHPLPARAGRFHATCGAPLRGDSRAARPRTGRRFVASDLFPSPGDADAARAFLSGLKPSTRLVAIHPGAGGETKRWPAESWAELGQRLCADLPRYRAARDRGRGR